VPSVTGNSLGPRGDSLVYTPIKLASIRFRTLNPNQDTVGYSKDKSR
jgi:hypothetical protein